MRARSGLLAFALLLGGCSGPERIEPPADAKPHLGAPWFAWRAAALGITPAQAEARDEAIAEDRPPANGVDRDCATEGAVVYRTLCAKCHGPDGAPPDEQPGGGPRPHSFAGVGARLGFFFGADPMRAGLYRTIRRGGEAKDGVASNMPGWASVLSREQTWALVRQFESF
jgi:mono/diheme cytochrome c family protein